MNFPDILLLYGNVDGNKTLREYVTRFSIYIVVFFISEPNPPVGIPDSQAKLILHGVIDLAEIRKMKQKYTYRYIYIYIRCISIKLLKSRDDYAQHTAHKKHNTLNTLHTCLSLHLQHSIETCNINGNNSGLLCANDQCV